MNPEAFMERNGIRGIVFTRNGPRLYVYGVRGRFTLVDGPRTSQRAWIDLDTYQPKLVSETTGEKESLLVRMRNEKALHHLRVTARLARIHKVKP